MTCSPLPHDYPFDPGYGYDLSRLLSVQTPPPPHDFARFWQQRYAQALSSMPRAHIESAGTLRRWQVFDLHFCAADGAWLGGWVLVPRYVKARQLWVVGHGYGGRSAPDGSWPLHDSVVFFPCARGFQRSRMPGIPEHAQQHVVHGIEDRDLYLVGQCVNDVWSCVSAACELFPQLDWLGYAGTSFGGGLGALAAPWDPRIRAVYLNVPTFGHWPLRLQLPTVGSGSAVQALHHSGRHVLETLSYYDAAHAAHFAQQPLFAALACFDPAVAPPGQFAIFIAWRGRKTLHLLTAGHFDYAARLKDELRLNRHFKHWSASLLTG